jgi:hypothetical protein
MMPNGIIVISIGMGDVIHHSHGYGVHTTNVVSSGIVSPRVFIRSIAIKGQKKVMSRPNACTNFKNAVHVFDLGGLAD